jgi:cytoskeletal protein CcmA (bactofilin family)/Zn finger protein HypA/HybF involved in hydrogenase expression
MPQLPRKAPSRCPHCGFVQEEPEHLISTYCRGCGSYYKVLPTSAAFAEYTSYATRKRTRRRVPVLPPRVVRCHHCDKVHEVSGYAWTTFCPECQAAIELSDITISSSTSRPIDTRGNLIVTPTGYISSALIVCNEALIAGRISGTLVCEGVLHLAYSGRLSCQMKAGSIIIEKEARIELSYPIKTGELTVYGQTAGNFECSGRIWIDKGGLVEGRIAARSVVVESGGTLLAESSVQPVHKEEPVEREEEFNVSIDAKHPLPAY